MTDTNKNYISANYNRMSVAEMAKNQRVPPSEVQSFMSVQNLKRCITGKRAKVEPVKKGCFDYNFKDFI